MLCHKTHSQNTPNAEGCQNTSADMSGVNVDEKRWRCRDCNGWRVRFHTAVTKQMDPATAATLKEYLKSDEDAKKGFEREVRECHGPEPAR